MVVEAQVSVSAKSPVALTGPNSRGAAPVFQTVTVCAWLAVPTGKLPKESVEGAAVSPGRVPCPLTVASVEVSPEVSLITSDPERVPVEVGEKLKLIEHEAPGCNVVRH